MRRFYLFVFTIVSAFVLLTSACLSSEDDETTDTNGASSDNSVFGECQIYGDLSPRCNDCLCKRCPEQAMKSNADSYDLIKCMDALCDRDPSTLDSCAEGPCSKWKNGLQGAKSMIGCMYNPADKNSSEKDQQSCYVECGFYSEPCVECWEDYAQRE